MTLAPHASPVTRATPRAGMTATWAPLWAGPNGYTGGPYTFVRLDSVEAPFVGYRLILANYSTSAPVTYPRIFAAPTAALSNSAPLNPDGTTATLDAVTTGGALACTVPAATIGTGGGTIPALVATDWMPRASVARSDGGKFPLLMTYTISGSSGGTCLTMPGATDLVWPTLLGGRTCRSVIAYKDETTNLVAGTFPAVDYVAGGGFGAVVAVQTICAGRVVTLMACGDSLAAGYLGTENVNAYGLRAVVDSLSTPAHPVSFISRGWAGTKTQDFLANARVMFDLVRPGIVTIPVISPNNPNSDAPGSLVAACNFADYVIQQGSLPVLVTPWPFGGVLSVDIPSGNAVRLMAGQGPLILDMQSLILDGTPLTVGAVGPRVLYGTDGAHGSDLGYSTAGKALAAILAPYVR